MSGKHISAVLLFLIFSQEIRSAEAKDSDWQVSGRVAYHDASFMLDPPSNSEGRTKLSYTTNTPLQYGLTFVWKGFGATIARTAGDPLLSGKSHTEYVFSSCSWFSDAFQIDWYYSRFSGFHTRFPKNLPSDERNRDDITMRTYGIDCTFRWSLYGDYSLRRAYRDRAQTMGLAALLVVSGYRSEIAGDGPLIPPTIGDQFAEEQNLTGVQGYGVGVYPGIAAAMNFGLFYVADQLCFGAGRWRGQYRYTDRETNDTSLSMRFFGKILFGKDFDGWGCTVYVIIDYSGYGDVVEVSPGLESLAFSASADF